MNDLPAPPMRLHQPAAEFRPLRTPAPVVAPQLLDLGEAAARLAVAPRTLRGWAAEGRLPYARLGRLLRFWETDIAAFIAASMVGEEG